MSKLLGTAVGAALGITLLQSPEVAAAADSHPGIEYEQPEEDVDNGDLLMIYGGIVLAHVVVVGGAIIRDRRLEHNAELATKIGVKLDD